MIELFGWLAVSEVYDDEDAYAPETLGAIMQNVKAIAAKYALPLHSVNGIPYLQTAFSANHHNADTDEILAAYREIAAAASGSYGVLYLRDDESADAPNAFLKYVFRRGECAVSVDTDLSPCVPVIEAPYETNADNEKVR